MKYFCLFFMALFFLSQLMAQNKNVVNIIPKPLSIEIEKGSFSLGDKTQIFYEQGLVEHAKFLAEYINFAHKTDIPINENSSPTGKNYILLKIDNNLNSDDEYVIKIQNDIVIATAKHPMGIFYAIQSLRQLFFESKILDCMTIHDKPRFQYRGMHLDVSRHFHPKEFVKKYIDFLAMYKLNIFHWHLVDDHGWRLEIKKYPKLTSVGAWRTDREGISWRDRIPQQPGEETTYGGFYTQDEVREIVQYAADRYVTILPEIEMPGHCMAALAAYPELSCTGGPFTVPTGTYWPPTDDFCAGNDYTFEFLENVLLEVMELFPFEYIHIGGDEAFKNRWKTCPKCLTRVEQENLKDIDELQSYFVKRIEKFILSKNKRIIGWDEIIEGGLAPEATVMSWRGMNGGIVAAKEGHDVIMAPTTYCYFDYYQGDPLLEPEAISGFVPISKVYTFEPIPEELTTEEAKHILGGQANLWCEFISNTKHVEYMVFPRITALTEVVWSAKENRDWDDFITRVHKHTRLLDALGVNYARSMYNVTITTTLDTIKKELTLHMNTEAKNSTIYYTLDGSTPTDKSTLYKGPFVLEKSATIKAVNYYSKDDASKVSTTEVAIHKGLGYKATDNKVDNTYQGKGVSALANGDRGSLNHGDEKWRGYPRHDFVAMLDLEKVTDVKTVTIGFLQNYRSSIYLPRELEIQISTDGNEFKSIDKIVVDTPINPTDRFIKDLALTVNEKARYIRIVGKNLEVNPEDHPSPGARAWIMVDEIIVE